MAAAVALAGRGIPVTVFESARQLGGRARGVVHQDTQLDNGQHLLLGCYHQTLSLIEKVGGNLERDFLRLPLQLDLHNHFSLLAPSLPAPFHLLAALSCAKGLTWMERMNAVRFMLTMRRMSFRLRHDLTACELLSLHKQDAALVQKLWEPLCIAALNTPIHKASAQVLLNVLRDALSRSRADSDMLLSRVDLGALFPERAANYIEQRGGKVQTSCGIEAIIPKDCGFELITCAEPVDASRTTFSHVICSAPPVIAARLLRQNMRLASVATQIEALQHQPIYTVYLQYSPKVRLPHPMQGLHRRFIQWLFDKGRVSGQHGLIAAVISAEGIHQELSHQQLAQKAIAELREEFCIDENPQWFKVIAEKRATFACSPNLNRPKQETVLPGLFLAGDYTAGDYPATLEGAVQSGLRCADLVLA